MEQTLINFLNEYKEVAFLLSIILNIIWSVVGILPSPVLTTVNIVVFGFWNGMLLTFIGEVIGSTIAFVLYRKGALHLKNYSPEKFKKLDKLLIVEGYRAFIFLLLFRLIPFIPSSLIALVAALGKVSILIFFLATLIGKLPAVIVETLAMQQILAVSWQEKVGIGVIFLGGFLLYLRTQRVVAKN